MHNKFLENNNTELTEVKKQKKNKLPAYTEIYLPAIKNYTVRFSWKTVFHDFSSLAWVITYCNYRW